jgi:hypothetical protein
LPVPYVASFDGDVFAIFADFEEAFVVFCTLVVAHLTCTWDRIHDVVRVPWTKGGYAPFGFASFMLQFGYAPAFDWTLEAFARGYGGCVDVLSFFEDFFGGYRFS